MENSFFAYLQQLEAMAFFSGYPLLYTIILSVSRNQRLKNNFTGRLYSQLPLAYAIAGTLYLGLQLRNLYPDYSIENITRSIQQPWLVGWGILSIFFWLPVLRRKPVFSLLHSLIFFTLLAKDIIDSIFQPYTDENVLKNDMKIYTVSLLLNLGALLLVALISLLTIRSGNQDRSLQ